MQPNHAETWRSVVRPAPAFNAERLDTLPRDEWIINGGTLSNQRYLSRIRGIPS